MTPVYPMKYLKVDGGYIALVWALEGPLNVSKQVEVGIGDNIIEVRCGQVVLPIADEMLPMLFQSPRIQVSFLTNQLIDDTHMIVELELPQLYEMKGALSVMRKSKSRPVESDRLEVNLQSTTDHLASSSEPQPGQC